MKIFRLSKVRVKQLCFICLILFVSCGHRVSIFRMPIRSLPISYDPIINGEFYSELINRNIFSTVLLRSENRLNNHLSEYWYPIADTLIFVKLKDKIHFSDGSLLTSLDVCESFNRALNHPASRLQINLNITVSIGKNNSLYIKVKDQENLLNSVGANILSSIPIYKADYIKKGDDFLRDNPLSVGEYYLSGKNENKIILKKNIYHQEYIKNNKAPDLVEIFYMPDQDQHWPAMKNGKIDFIQYLPINDYQEVINSKNYTIIDVDSRYIVGLHLNAAAEDHPDVSTLKNPLQDNRVRLAIGHAIDIKFFIEQILCYKGSSLSVPLVKSSVYYPVDLDFYAFNPELSLKLLAEAGYPDGFSMRVRVVDGKYSKYLGFYLQESLQKIKIQIEPEIYEISQFTESLKDSLPCADISIISQQDEIQRIIRLNTYYRSSSYVDQYPKINSLIEQLGAANTSIDEFTQCMKELVRMMHSTALVIPLVNPIEPYVLSKKFSYEKRDNLYFVDFKTKK